MVFSRPTWRLAARGKRPSGSSWTISSPSTEGDLDEEPPTPRELLDDLLVMSLEHRRKKQKPRRSTATAKAILIACEGEEVWVPTSQVHEDSEVYKPGTEEILVIPQWVAEMKELPYRETRMVR